MTCLQKMLSAIGAGYHPDVAVDLHAGFAEAGATSSRSNWRTCDDRASRPERARPNTQDTRKHVFLPAEPLQKNLALDFKHLKSREIMRKLAARNRRL